MNSILQASLHQPVQDVLALLSKIGGVFGAKVDPPEYPCGTFMRELASGVTLGVPPTTPAVGEPPLTAFVRDDVDRGVRG